MNKTFSRKIFSMLTSALFLLSAFLLPFQTGSAVTTLFSDNFESGNLTGWSSHDPVWSATSPDGHNSVFKGEAVGSTGMNDDMLVKNISTSGYESLALSFWYKASSLDSLSHVYVEWFDGTNWNQLADYQQVTADWTQAAFNLPAGAGNLNSFSLRFVAHLESSFDTFLLDDVNITATGTPSPENSTVIFSGGSATTAGGTITFTITAKDGSGTTMEGVSASISASPAEGCTYVPPSAVLTNSSGIAQIELQCTKAGTKTITATLNGIELNSHPSVSFTPADLDHILVSGPSEVQAGSAIQYTAEGFDFYENPKPGQTYTWSVINGTGSGTIDSAGNFTGQTGGTATIRATSASNTNIFGAIEVNILRQEQTINFGPLADMTYGDGPITLSATSSSGLPVGFSVEPGSPAEISGSTLSVIGAGAVSVIASQPGNGIYAPAQDVVQTFNINPKEITVTANAGQSKIYGQGDPLPFTYTNDPLFGSDEFSGQLERETGENAGQYQILIGTLSAGANYSINFISENFTIEPKQLTVTAVTDTKEYDGTVDSLGIPVLSGELAEGDTANFTQSFNNKNVGTGKTLAPEGIVEDGNGGANYVYEFVADETGVVTQKTITATAQGQDKVYDGTTDAVVNVLADIIAEDDVLLNYADASFYNPNVGQDKIIEVSGIFLEGSDAPNYILENTTAQTTASILAKLIAVISNPGQKTYGEPDPEEFTYTFTPSLVSPDEFLGSLEREPGEEVGVYEINQGTLTAGENYEIDFTSGLFLITGYSVSATITAEDRTYDGTTDATISDCTLSGVQGTDDVYCTVLSASFDNKNAGTNKAVTATEIILEGENAQNYELAEDSAQTTADILPLNITVTAVTDTKEYDGTVDSLGIPVLSGELAEGDTANFTQSFDNKNVGTGKTLAPEGIVEDGNGGANYVYEFVADETGVVTVRPINVTVSAENKQYDGTTAANVTLQTDAIEGDDITATYESAEFDTPEIGTGKTINVLGISVAGTDQANYELQNNTATVTADIIPLQITVTANNKEKFYGDPDPELDYIYSPDLFPEDSFEGTLEREAGESVGQYAITQGSLSLNSNYQIIFIEGTFEIKKIVPEITWENPSPVPAGTTLDQTQLNAQANVDGTFTYDPAAGTQLTTTGENQLCATFEPTDSENYATAEKCVNIEVLPGQMVTLEITASNENPAFDQPVTITVLGKDSFDNIATGNSSAQIVLSADGGGSLENSILQLQEGSAQTNLTKDSPGTVHVTASSEGFSPVSVTVIFTEADVTSPEVLWGYPENLATEVPVTTQPYLIFSEPLNPETVTSSNVQLWKVGGEAIPSLVSLDYMEGKQRVKISPLSNLDFGTEYYMAITSGLTDFAGNPAVAIDYESENGYEFTTIQDETTLSVTGISALKTYATANGAYESGWSWEFSVTIPMHETEYSMKFSDWTSTLNSIPAGGNIRYSSEQSSSSPAEVETANTYGPEIHLTGDLDPGAQGRQVKILVEARVPSGSAGGSYSTSYAIRTLELN